MSFILDTVRSFDGVCACGRRHKTSVRDVRIGSGLVNSVGQILRENDFPKSILLVSDENAIKASEGIKESLGGLEVEYLIWKDMRLATTDHVDEVASLIRGRDIAVLSVGTGSVNDPCRLAAAREDKLLCIFGTAPSMDGFASYGAPILENGFKLSFDAKSPEVIIGDTKILASAPSELKSSGFGDMVAKYVGLIDWRISSLLTNEPYCERVAALTECAINTLMGMADRVTVNDEETAGKIFEALLMTGIGMSFMQNSRPASGSEHVVAHLMECIQLQRGEIEYPNLHGEDVGVATLEMLKLYESYAEHECISAKKEDMNKEEIYGYYGSLADDIKKFNEPDTVCDLFTPKDIEDNWQKIRDIIHSYPSYSECRDAMQRAGCKITVKDIGKTQKLFDECVKYSPYMRRRLTLLRIRDMIIIPKGD